MDYPNLYGMEPLLIVYHCRQQVEHSKEDARADGVVVPETIDDYCIKSKPDDEDDNLDCIDFG